MAFLKKFILGVLITILCLGTYHYRDILANYYHQGFRHLLPCKSSITYSLGDIDPRFHLEKSEILTVIETAKKPWEEASNAQLFEYTETGGTLTVNFIYDERQQMTEDLQEIGGTISEKRETYTSLKTKYDAESLAYEKAKNDFETKIHKLTEEQNTYEEQVSYWNKLGGAPEKELNELEATRKSLNSRLDILNGQQKKLNNQVTSINSMANTINKLIADLNLNVREYNTISKTNGEEFEEGEYIRDGQGERIQIYEFSSDEKLTRVMMHELGHALGLDHVEDPEGIMYRLNQGKGMKLSTGDIHALKTLCKMN